MQIRKNDHQDKTQIQKVNQHGLIVLKEMRLVLRHRILRGKSRYRPIAQIGTNYSTQKYNDTEQTRHFIRTDTQHLDIREGAFVDRAHHQTYEPDYDICEK
jgi:hypothetical protein